MPIPEYKNGHFEEMAAWLQILKIVGNSTLIYLSFNTPQGRLCIEMEIFCPNVPVCRGSKSFPCPAYGNPNLFPISRKGLNASLIEFFKNAPMKFQSHCVLHHSTYFPIVTNFNEILWICSVHTSLARSMAKSLKLENIY